MPDINPFEDKAPSTDSQATGPLCLVCDRTDVPVRSFGLARSGVCLSCAKAAVEDLTRYEGKPVVLMPDPHHIKILSRPEIYRDKRGQLTFTIQNQEAQNA